MTNYTQKLFVLEASGGGWHSPSTPTGPKDVDRHQVSCPRRGGSRCRGQARLLDQHGRAAGPGRSIERVDLDGNNRTTIVPSGGTYTPKRLHFDAAGRKLAGLTAKACG